MIVFDVQQVRGGSHPHAVIIVEKVHIFLVLFFIPADLK